MEFVRKNTKRVGMNQYFKLTLTFQFLILNYIRCSYLGNPRMYMNLVKENHIYPVNQFFVIVIRYLSLTSALLISSNISM